MAESNGLVPATVLDRREWWAAWEDNWNYQRGEKYQKASTIPTMLTRLIKQVVMNIAFLCHVKLSAVVSLCDMSSRYELFSVCNPSFPPQ
jgi:hypothetical protein